MDTYPVTLHKEDRSLTVGKEVLARWTRNGFCYCSKGKVVALKARSLIVELLEPAGHRGEFVIGNQIEVPRTSNVPMWSSNNCAQPAAKEGFRHKDFL